MTEFELSLWLMWSVLAFAYIYWNMGNFGSNNTKIINNKENKEYSKLIKQFEKEQLALENLLIQKEEYENEINKLEFESSSDFEKEWINSTKIKKLKLKIRHILISIDEKNNTLNELNNKLSWISMN